jgi:dTMP kinase
LIREILLARASALSARAEFALYLASRAQLVDEVIRPSLADGVDVVCDRFTDSSTAYQGGGRGLGAALVESMNDWATGGLRPDLTLYFDVSARTGLARRSARGGGGEQLDRMEREPIEFHERVRNAFREIAQRAPNRFKIVAVEGEEERVWGQVQPILEELLRAKQARE